MKSTVYLEAESSRIETACASITWQALIMHVIPLRSLTNFTTLAFSSSVSSSSLVADTIWDSPRLPFTYAMVHESDIHCYALVIHRGAGHQLAPSQQSAYACVSCLPLAPRVVLSSQHWLRHTLSLIIDAVTAPQPFRNTPADSSTSDLRPHRSSPGHTSLVG